MQNNFIKRIGIEKQVNSVTNSDQVHPEIFKVNDNKSIVTWASLNEDGSAWGIYAQFLNNNNVKIGNPFLVNTYTSNHQYLPTVGVFNNGKILIAWTSLHEDGSGWGCYAQIFDGNGMKIGSAKRINSYTSGDQGYAVVDGIDFAGRLRAYPTIDDKMFLTWVSNGQDGSSGGIYGCVIKSNGAIEVTDFRINDYTANWQIYPSVRTFSNGNIAVSYSSLGEDRHDWGVIMKLYDQSFNPIKFPVYEESSFNNYRIFVANNNFRSQVDSSIVELEDGNFAVIWDTNYFTSFGFDLEGQIFDANANKIGEPFIVNSYRTDDQRYPVSESILNGKFFLVSWQSYVQDGSGWGIYAQIFDKIGNKIGIEYKVNLLSYDHQSNVAMEVVNDSDPKNIQVIFTWNSLGQDGSGYGIYSQKFSFDMSEFISIDEVDNLSSVINLKEILSNHTHSISELEDKVLALSDSCARNNQVENLDGDMQQIRHLMEKLSGDCADFSKALNSSCASFIEQYDF